MSSYHSSFGYLGKRSDDQEFGWVISHFDGDSGESDTFLSTDSVFSESYDGTRRTIYGAKYNAVATPQITVIKQDGTNFSVQQIRDALKWLTGTKQSSWMDFYIGDDTNPKYRMLGRVQDVKQYKMDARTIGLVIYFESVSPWAYSSLQTVEVDNLSGSMLKTINNPSDDLYSYTNLKTTYTNTSGSSLTIKNENTQKTTSISGLLENETITITDNMMILSDSPSRNFSNNFNFVFPQLVAGSNTLTLNGNGQITFEYTYPIKIGDLAIDINSISEPICNDEGDIIIETLPWERVSGIPNTLSGYHISDAYTKTEVDAKLSNSITGLQIDENQLNNILSEILI